MFDRRAHFASTFELIDSQIKFWRKCRRMDIYLIIFNTGMTLINGINLWAHDSGFGFHLIAFLISPAAVGFTIWSRRRTGRRLKHLAAMRKHLHGMTTTWSNIAIEHHMDQFETALREL